MTQRPTDFLSRAKTWLHTFAYRASLCGAGTSNISEIDEAVFLRVQFRFSVVNDLGGGNSIAENRAKIIKVFEKILVESPRRFDFVGVNFAAFLFDKINFLLQIVPVKVEIRAACDVEFPFELFGNNEVFKQFSAQGMVLQLFFGIDVEQPARQTGIVKIQFVRFDDALANIFEKRRQSKYQIGGFERRNPRMDGFSRDSEHIGKLCSVDFASDGTRTKPHKIFERGKVAHVDEFTQISFDIRGVIVGVKCVLGNNGSLQFRVTPAKNQLVGRYCTMFGGKFIKREGQECENRRAPGERLCDAAHQRKIAASRKNEATGTVFVHEHLRCGKKFRRSLSFVNDEIASVGMLEKKFSRRLNRGKSRSRIFHIDVAVGRKEFFAQRCFSRLARSRNCCYGEKFLLSDYFCGDFALNKHGFSKFAYDLTRINKASQAIFAERKFNLQSGVFGFWADFSLGEAVFNRFAGTAFGGGNCRVSSFVRAYRGEDADVFPPNSTGTPSLIFNL